MDRLINFTRVKNSHSLLRENMQYHYSAPKGFVGRNLCYLVYVEDVCYGSIVAGSAIMHLKGRDEFFALNSNKSQAIQRIINNTFYHIEPVNGRYPIRWQFTAKVLARFREVAAQDWLLKYNVPVIGFESLIELPRTGKIYEQDGWEEVGVTEGFTCKRIAGKGTDSWTGKRVWNTDPAARRPKRVFCRRHD